MALLLVLGFGMILATIPLLAEEKAQQVPVKITIPLIFCILPTLSSRSWDQR